MSRNRYSMLRVLGCALLIASCSASVDIPAGLEPGFSVEAALAQIPVEAVAETGASIQIVVADVDAAAEQARLVRPIDSRDADEVFSFFGPLTGVSRSGEPMRVFVPFPQFFANRAVGDPAGFEDEIGFSPADVRTFVALEAAPANFVVVTGVSAVTGLPEVAPGVTTIGEGEDYEQSLEQTTTARPLGRPWRLAQQDDVLAASLATAPLSVWLEGSPRGTLADNRDLMAVARRLDEEQVVSAYLAEVEDRRYFNVGLGWDARDGQARGVVVFALGSERAAQSALGLLEGSFEGVSFASNRPLAELVSLEKIEVRGAEIVAIVRFPDGRPPSTTLQMLITEDGPFAR